jgi:hypothetical protein
LAAALALALAVVALASALVALASALVALAAALAAVVVLLHAHHGRERAPPLGQAADFAGVKVRMQPVSEQRVRG